MEHMVLEVGLALSLIAVAALISARLRFSVVPLLILAGMVVGPHAPKIGPLDFRFIESAPLIEFMGRVGVLWLVARSTSVSTSCWVLDTRHCWAGPSKRFS
jgi:CPA2 family monovalent cation:H+ antiporter-2